MSRHLSQQQLSEWILNEPGRETEEHLRDCDNCRTEAARMKEALADFRTGVRAWSEPIQPSRQWRSEAPQRVWSGTVWAWAGLAVAACLLAIFGLIPRVHPPAAASVAAADAALLKQVSSEVSRSVPASMEPLARLVSWDEQTGTSSASGNSGAGTEKN